MDVLFNIIWYIFKDNGKFNPVQPGGADDGFLFFYRMDMNRSMNHEMNC